MAILIDCGWWHGVRLRLIRQSGLYIIFGIPAGWVQCFTMCSSRSRVCLCRVCVVSNLGIPSLRAPLDCETRPFIDTPDSPNEQEGNASRSCLRVPKSPGSASAIGFEMCRWPDACTFRTLLALGGPRVAALPLPFPPTGFHPQWS